LVVVIELHGNTQEEVVTRKVLALARALDVLESRRSLTAVLTSGQPSPTMVQSISRVCRVLSVGAPTGPAALQTIRDWLSVLLPIALPTATEELLDWEGDLRAKLAHRLAEPAIAGWLAAARSGQRAVDDKFALAVSVDISPVLSVKPEGE
jgi:hypothetical protein